VRSWIGGILEWSMVSPRNAESFPGLYICGVGVIEDGHDGGIVQRRRGSFGGRCSDVVLRCEATGPKTERGNHYRKGVAGS